MILNKTPFHNQRYRIVEGEMGSYKEPSDSPCHKWQIVTGIDRGNGYPSYMSIDYFFCKCTDFFARINAIDFLKSEGYEEWLKRHGII